METRKTNPILVPASSAVLLLFMPLDRQQRSALSVLADSLQKRLNGSVRVLKIDEATHPEVVRSFDIGQIPALVLVRQGVELWRQEGLTDPNLLATVTQKVAGL